MNSVHITESYLNQIIEQALAEDVGDGDHSSLATLPLEQIGEAKLVAKEAGVLAGVALAKRIYKQLSKEIELTAFKNDGDELAVGDVVFTLKGPVQLLLTGERLVLNFMQRLSGVASYTRKLVNLVDGTEAQILDTRKTTPLLRPLEKWAVTVGGGTNHRFGLFDMVMLKDNHIDFNGGITKAVQKTKAYLQSINKQLKIEVETRNLKEVQEALQCGVDVIMLDNMNPETMRKAVEMVAGKVKTEASGGITEENIREAALTGVDYISIGALTHSVKSLDLSLKAI